MNIRNAIDAGDGIILCEVEHQKYGWIPYSATANDIEEMGREIHAQASMMDLAPMPAPSRDELEAKEKRVKDIADEEAAKSDQKLQGFAALSPDEVRAWTAKNVNTLADAKDVIATLAVAVSVLTRKL
jgi:ribosome-binding ATPase YchF (GTP1/OBG family)